MGVARLPTYKQREHTHRTGPLTKEEMFRVEIRLTFGLF